ncbi:TetR/AcrR family transcriptional regulator [Lactococcus allomyrinae]|uniref:TetR/AcrR family transcriptional regulator n=1 Tax=Lactococcus allomyrinae TaxID=2419773 RepID=A0A387BGN6_9LACT|nr:TetR/AcrR family transcriptional regulator [Lactococcus allomyrinae]AYG00020.1 TetR/AcrR family transcriptional regulator [Lactococcus allomyrinae]
MCYNQFMSLREEKKKAKRLEIIENALRLFEEKGFDGVTTEEIAAASAIAKKTLFQYFPSKDDIIFNDETVLLDLIASWLRANPDKVWEGYPDFIRQCIADDDDPKNFFTLPKIIDETPHLRLRLLKTWTLYEQNITELLVASAYSALDARILANKMVLILRLLFEGSFSVEDVLSRV